jgi:WD40 repeat protein
MHTVIRPWHAFITRYAVAVLLGLVAAGPAAVAGPTDEPLLRVETDMHTTRIFRIAIDAQQRYLATASDDKTLRVWNLRTGTLLATLRPPIDEGNEGKLHAVAMSPDGEYIAAGGWTGYRWDKTNSIYIFHRSSGRLVRRVTGLPETIAYLAYSPDGRFLAATTLAKTGVHVYRTDDFRLIGRDNEYGDSTYSAHFSRDHRLVTASDDGHVRLYRVTDDGLQLVARQRLIHGREAAIARFSPDGRRIAVGVYDLARIEVLDGQNLEFQYAPNVAGLSGGNLIAVTWSADGNALYAGGTTKIDGRHPFRRWTQAGRGSHSDHYVTRNTLLDALPLANGGLVYSAADPAWGVIDGEGRQGTHIGSVTNDLRMRRDQFRLSPDGSRVQFVTGAGAGRGMQFDVAQSQLRADGDQNGLTPPRTTSPDFQVENWQHTLRPTFNGNPIPLGNQERSRSLAISPDGGQFVLGTEWSLRAYTRNGQLAWRNQMPGVVWGVNISGDGRLVVAAVADGTLRWFRLSDGRELLALFAHADGKRWVLWTPAGHFDASPGADNLIGWHINRGKDQPADFFPASRFRSQFYRPELAALVLRTADPAEALRQANAQAGRRPETVQIQQVLPPVVEIHSPSDGSAFSTGEVTLRFAVRTAADAPVTDLRTRVNGQLVSIPAARNLVVGLRPGDARELTVPLPPRDSEIMLFAENRHGVSTPAVIRLTWKGAAPDQKQPEFQVKPKLYVLAIGVSNYQKPDYRLRFAAKDARDFSEAMTRQKGRLYRDVEIRLLTDQIATRDDVADGLDWLQKQVTQKDVGMVFLAGHGVNDPNGHYYFLPQNADTDRLKRTGVPFSDIKNTLSTLAGKALFFVDTCHSGNIIGGRRAAVAANITGALNELSSAENGVVVFSSSTGRQYSLEDPRWGNGAFTKALVEAIGGQADYNKNGRITYKILDFYISERVKQLTAGQQTPVTLTPHGVPDFPVVVLR